MIKVKSATDPSDFKPPSRQASGGIFFDFLIYVRWDNAKNGLKGKQMGYFYVNHGP